MHTPDFLHLNPSPSPPPLDGARNTHSWRCHSLPLSWPRGHWLTGVCRVCVQTTDKSAVETAIESAKESCESGTTGECAAAWDEVRTECHHCRQGAATCRTWPSRAVPAKCTTHTRIAGDDAGINGSQRAHMGCTNDRSELHSFPCRGMPPESCSDSCAMKVVGP